VGGPLAVFRFLRREIPIIEVDPAGAARPLTVDNHGDSQPRDEDGVGPVVRLYGSTIRTPQLTAGRLLAIIAADPDVIAPSEILRSRRSEARRAACGRATNRSSTRSPAARTGRASRARRGRPDRDGNPDPRANRRRQLPRAAADWPNQANAVLRSRSPSRLGGTVLCTRLYGLAAGPSNGVEVRSVGAAVDCSGRPRALGASRVPDCPESWNLQLVRIRRAATTI
jgi:hypothetical protein